MNVHPAVRLIVVGFSAVLSIACSSGRDDGGGEGAGVAGAQVVREGGSVEANGITIAYESFGPSDRETILLIAGHGAQMTMWPDELGEELVRRGYRVVRFDNRDVGLSSHLDHLGPPDWEAIVAESNAGRPPPVPYTLADMSDDAVALLTAIGVERAHIVGASMGGMIAQIIASEHPERTYSLTSIASTTGNPEMPGMTEEVLALPPPLPADSDPDSIVAQGVQVWRTLGSPDYPTEDSILRERVWQDFQRSYDPGATERHSAAVLTAGDRRELLRTIQVPTVVVHGDADPMLPIENGRETAETIPGAELRVITGMGHDIPLQLVPAFADAITTAAARGSPGP